MSPSGKPQLFIITGSNGAGKSTLKQALLPPDFGHLDIFDGDVFFTQKKTEFYKKYKSDKEAKKLADEALEEHFLQLVDTHIEEGKHFAYEGHFTGPGAWKIPERFKAADFDVNLIFCGLNAVVKSIQRVEIRVKKNGFMSPRSTFRTTFTEIWKWSIGIMLCWTPLRLSTHLTVHPTMYAVSVRRHVLPSWRTNSCPDGLKMVFIIFISCLLKAKVVTMRMIKRSLVSIATSSRSGRVQKQKKRYF